MIIVVKGKFTRAKWTRDQANEMGFGQSEELASTFKWRLRRWFREAQWNARSTEKRKHQLLCTVSRHANQLAEAIFCDECRQVTNKLSIIKYCHFSEKLFTLNMYTGELQNMTNAIRTDVRRFTTNEFDWNCSHRTWMMTVLLNDWPSTHTWTIPMKLLVGNGIAIVRILSKQSKRTLKQIKW